MAYGTGTIPFIRTSDISNWELKSDPKQGVSPAIYESFQKKVDVRAGDILMVRDGTYLIGISAIITEQDTRMLFQSHILKLRVNPNTLISHWLLFACLNSDIVRRQIRSKQFTQDIIDTLGNRIQEIIIPVPKDAAKRLAIEETTKTVVEERARLRDLARRVGYDIEGRAYPQNEEDELE